MSEIRFCALTVWIATRERRLSGIFYDGLGPISEVSI
jgi:hypothetical protein